MSLNDLSTSIGVYWVVWVNEHSGNRTLVAHATVTGYRTLCGCSIGHLGTDASLAIPRCMRCVESEKQFAQSQSVVESAEQ